MNIFFHKNISSGKVQIWFGEMNVQSTFKILYLAKLSASILRSSCSLINIENCSTSSGKDNHSIVGIMFITLAKNFIIFKSRLILSSTLGCKTLMATNSFESKCSVTTMFSKIVPVCLRLVISIV